MAIAKCGKTARFEWLLSPPESTGIALEALGAFFFDTLSSEKMVIRGRFSVY
jgi:hypothetical protein